MSDSKGSNNGHSNKKNIKESVRRYGIILTGFSILQSLRLTVTGGSYAVKRFGIDRGETGLFIKTTLNTTEIFCILGIIMTTIYCLVRGNNKKADKYISIYLAWQNFFSFVLIFLSYSTGGKEGHLTFYYWSLVLGSFSYGLHQSLVFNIITKEAAYYFIGLPTSGIQILLFHVGFRTYYKLCNKENIEYYLVINQILVALFLWLFTAMLWTYGFYDYDPEKGIDGMGDKGQVQIQNGESTGSSGNGNGSSEEEKKKIEEAKNATMATRIRESISPFLMNIFGMMFGFLFYPAIAPYELVDSDLGYKTDLFILFVSTIAAVVLVLLVYFKIGPNQKWAGKFVVYNYVWFLFIPYYGCFVIFLILLHNPESPISKFIKDRPLIICGLTILSRACDDTIRGISTTGLSMQRAIQDGDVATIANCIAQTLLNVFSFIGLGYIRTYRMYKHDRDNWPTKDFGIWDSFWFWFSNASSRGWKAFLQSFTLDVRSYFKPMDIDEITVL